MAEFILNFVRIWMWKMNRKQAFALHALKSEIIHIMNLSMNLESNKNKPWTSKCFWTVFVLFLLLFMVFVLARNTLVTKLFLCCVTAIRIKTLYFFCCDVTTTPVLQHSVFQRKEKPNQKLPIPILKCFIWNRI